MYPDLFSHSIGYVGILEGDALEQKLSNQSIKPKETIFNYSSGFIEGKTGIESIYDDNLSVKFYTPIGDTLLYGITNTTPGSGYLDIHDDNLILVSSSGVIGYSKKPLNKPKFGISLKQIQNNLKNFIDIEQFKKSRHFDDPKYSWLKGGWYSIKDVEIFDGDIYVSYTKEVKENCWNTSLLSAKMNYVYIHFTTLFTSEECVNEYDNIDDEYNAHQSGGRIINLNNEIVLFLKKYLIMHL